MENKQICTLIIDKEISPLFVPKTDKELEEIKHQLTYEGFQRECKLFCVNLLDS